MLGRTFAKPKKLGTLTVTILVSAALMMFYGVRKAESQVPNRSGQTITRLSDGRQLLLGGKSADAHSDNGYIWNPKTEILTQLAAKMQNGRAWHTATVLPDGTVLILGGIGGNGQVVPTGELFDPESQAFSAYPLEGLSARAHHSSTLLTDGHILIVGGIGSNSETLATADIWNYSDGTSASVRGLITARADHSATLLPDGRVLLWGGVNSDNEAQSGGELFDFSFLRFTQVTSYPTGEFPLATDAPALVDSIPPDAMPEVPSDAVIAMRFSKPLLAETINSSTLSLNGPKGIETIKVVVAEDGRLAYITPERLLLADATYTVTVNGAVDSDSLLLPASGFSFSTSSKRGGGSSGAGPVSGLQPVTPQVPTTSAGGNNAGEWKGAKRNGKPHSPWQDLPALQAERGVTALAGQVLQLNGEPLRDVTIRVGDRRARTNPTGRFLVTSLEPGRHPMIIDGRTANHDGKTYGIFIPAIDLKKGETNVLPFTIWMAELDMANAVTITSPTTNDIVVSNPKIPGLEVHIPAGTVIRDIDGHPVTKVSITPLPLDRGPMPGPSGVQFPFLFTIQPGGSRVEGSEGIRIVFPNFANLPTGTQFDYWRPDPLKSWLIYGKGIVSADGKQIIPTAGTVMPMFSCASLGAHAPPEPPLCAEEAQCGDPVDLFTGLFLQNDTDLVINDSIPITFTRHYNSLDNATREFGRGYTHNYAMFIVGQSERFGGACSFADLVIPNSGLVHFDRISGTNCTNATLENTSSAAGKYFKARLSRQTWCPIIFGVPQDPCPDAWRLKLKDGTEYQFILFPTTEVVVPEVIKDRKGNRLTIAYDNWGRITRITFSNGRWVDFTFTNERITQAVDNSGRVVTYTYDANDRLWKVTDPENGITEYTYDTQDRMLTVKDRRGNIVVSNTYDTNGRVERQNIAPGTVDEAVFQFAYTIDSGTGKVTQTNVTDPRNIANRWTFNGNGYPLTITKGLNTPEQQTTSYVRDAITNRVTRKTDALNRNTDYSYDANSNLLSITRMAGTAEANTTTYTYEPVYNQITTMTNPLGAGHTTTLTYDAMGNVIRIDDPLNNPTSFTYDSVGHPTALITPAGTTQFVYTGGDLTQIRDPLNNTTTQFFDAAGRRVSVIDAKGQRTFYEYDKLNRLKTITDQLDGVTQFAHDPNGNLLSVVDALNNETSYTYDIRNRLKTRKDPLVAVPAENYQYDQMGNLLQFTDRKLQTTIYQYDSVNRRKKATFADLASTEYVYDNGNRLTQILDSVSGNIARTYDNLDRMTVETTPQGTITYVFDAGGRRTRMIVPGQSDVVYNYDNAGRLTTITQATSNVLFGYDTSNRRTSLTLPNGIVVQYGYDAVYRVTSLTYTRNSTTLGNLTYDYDQIGNRTNIGGTWARTGLPQSITSSNYNDANQQLVLRDKTMTFDNNGNLSTLIDASGTTSYNWNVRNQLSSVSGPGINANFIYDGIGRREKKTINGTLTEFLYDRFNPVQETSGTTVHANILTGLSMDQVFIRENVAAGITSSFLSDALGSTIALADSAGAVNTEYSYEPFGATNFTGSSNNSSFQYTGRENDGIGLYYYRTRYYSSDLQRFISEDTIGFQGGDFNIYGYVGNNPLNFVDPTGRAKDDCCECPSWGEWGWSMGKRGRRCRSLSG